MTPAGRIALAAIVAVAQVAFLGSAIYGRAAILRDGQEIVLPVEPVDPRDLLRGDYVALSYAISQVPAALVRDPPDRDGRTIGNVTLRVSRKPDGTVEPLALFFGQPDQGAGEGDLDLAGRTTATWTTGVETIPVLYGIERFYLPEGKGRPIETELSDRSFTMRVAVAEDGVMQIKSFHHAGEQLYREPLY